MLLKVGLVVSPANGQRPKAKARDRVVGATWKIQARRTTGGEPDGASLEGRLRVFNDEVFSGPRKIGYIKPDGPLNSRMVIEDHKSMKGTYTLTKTGKRPEVWAGSLENADGSTWRVRIEVLSY